jgi:hypothetical protein
MKVLELTLEEAQKVAFSVVFVPFEDFMEFLASVRTTLIALWIAIGVVGCATKNIIELGDGRIRLEYSEFAAQPHSAASIFDYNLRSRCPAGYDKIKDEVEQRGADRFYVWEVRCK